MGDRARFEYLPLGDGRFSKNWPVSQWEMGDLFKITPSPGGRWGDSDPVCPPPKLIRNGEILTVPGNAVFL